VHSVRSGQAVPITSTERQATARRLRAARTLAGGPSWQALARQTGMSYGHLLGVLNAREPMTFTDARDLAAALGVPVRWLRYGWTGTGAGLTRR
jgi:hypothetical protein